MLSTGLLLAASMVVGQAAEPESNYDCLKEFGEAFEGKWVAEFEMDFDIPNVVAVGDKVTIRVSTVWILNKTALETNWEADINGKAAGSGKSLIGWDRSTREIREFGFGSFGGSGQSSFQKVGDVWIDAHVGATIEGRKQAVTNIIKFSDDGDTRFVELTGRITPAGEPLPNFTITYKRVKANK